MNLKLGKINEVRRDLFDNRVVPDSQLLTEVGPRISWNDNFWTIHPITRDLGDIINGMLISVSWKSHIELKTPTRNQSSRGERREERSKESKKENIFLYHE